MPTAAEAQLTSAYSGRVSQPVVKTVIVSSSQQQQQRAQQFVCQVGGSRPPAVISWYKEEGDQSVLIGEGAAQSQSDSDYLTTSILNLVVSANDNGKRLTCQGRNEQIARTGSRGLVTAHALLDVLCKWRKPQ